MKFGPNDLNPHIEIDQNGDAIGVWDDGFGNKIIKKVDEE